VSGLDNKGRGRQRERLWRLVLANSAAEASLLEWVVEIVGDPKFLFPRSRLA